MSRPSWFVPALAFMLFHALAVSSAPPESTARVFFPEKLEALGELIRGAVGSNQAPGAVLWLERAGVIHTNVIGRRALQPEPEPMSVETVFDAASLTTGQIR